MLEHIVWLLLKSIMPEFQVKIIKNVLGGALDFYVRDNNKRIAIEVKNSPLKTQEIVRLLNIVKKERLKIDRLLVVTPDEPSNPEQRLFETIFKGTSIDAKWTSTGNLLQVLGVGKKIKLTPQKIERLQRNTIISSVDLYSKAPTGTLAYSKPGRVGTKKKNIGKKKTEASNLAIHLARQFPLPMIKKITEDELSVDEIFRFGENFPNLIVMLTDIKAFSTLVRVARPDEMRELMSSYYFRTREAIFRHMGVLDKFIGDAILTIWGYPYNTKQDVSNALKCAAELIEIGKWLVSEFSERHDEVVDSGTRIGLVKGDLWPLNLSQTDIEVSFIGNAINLAARLEGNSKVDSILISNQAKLQVEKEGIIDLKNLKIKQRILKPDDVKGQLTKIKTWQIPVQAINNI